MSVAAYGAKTEWLVCSAGLASVVNYIISAVSAQSVHAVGLFSLLL